MLWVTVVGFYTRYHPNEYVYNAAGTAACTTAAISSFVATIFTASDLLVFHRITRQQTIEQKKYELANFLFISYIVLGSCIFSVLEKWNFERAGQFCLMTLLTIGYGDIVPQTFWGRLTMIIYTIFGLCLAGFILFHSKMLLVEILPN